MTVRHGNGSLELFISDPMQLFNSMDPAPFRERDLDAQVVDYIIDWVAEVPAGTQLALVVNLRQPPRTDGTDEAGVLRDAVHSDFTRRAAGARRRLKKLFRDGRISLVIGLTFLAAAIVISDYVSGLVSNENYAFLIQESMVIGGWVALWHPISIFLYEWWPIRAEAKLYDRLGAMPVSLRHVPDATAKAAP